MYRQPDHEDIYEMDYNNNSARNRLPRFNNYSNQ